MCVQGSLLRCNCPQKEVLTLQEQQGSIECQTAADNLYKLTFRELTVRREPILKATRDIHGEIFGW